MADYIEREALIDDFNHFAPEYYNALINDLICKQPTADVAPVVHGRWVEYPALHYFKCSKCKYTVPYRKAVLFNGKRSYNYCPHCGAKMDGGADNAAD